MKHLRVLMVAGVILGCLGCGVHVVKRGEPGTRTRIPPARPVGASVSAIDAAMSLHFRTDRAEALEKIADGAFLSEAEQIYFIDRVAEADLFRSDTADILEALAKNPSLTNGGAGYLVQSFQGMGLFSSDQKRVSNILIDRALVQ